MNIFMVLFIVVVIVTVRVGENVPPLPHFADQLHISTLLMNIFMVLFIVVVIVIVFLVHILIHFFLLLLLVLAILLFVTLLILLVCLVFVVLLVITALLRFEEIIGEKEKNICQFLQRVLVDLRLAHRCRISPQSEVILISVMVLVGRFEAVDLRCVGTFVGRPEVVAFVVLMITRILVLLGRLMGIMVLVLVTLAATVNDVLQVGSLCVGREDEQSSGGDGQHLHLAVKDGGRGEEGRPRTGSAEDGLALTTWRAAEEAKEAKSRTCVDHVGEEDEEGHLQFKIE